MASYPPDPDRQPARRHGRPAGRRGTGRLRGSRRRSDRVGADRATVAGGGGHGHGPVSVRRPAAAPQHPTVLKDVSYGAVSSYMAATPGQYTVAMRGFGAPATSKPALTTSFEVSAGAAYTLDAIGPDPGLRAAVV